MASVEQFVNSVLQSKRVVVFSKSYCPYCSKAKDELANYNLSQADYQVVEIEDREDCNELQDYFQKITGARSVPRVFIGGKFVGGGDDVVRLGKSGELKKLLEAAGVK